MIAVPGGSISLKNEASGAWSTVALAPFRIGRHAVTAAQYRQLAPGDPARGGDTPMVDVSWLDAIAFCNLLSAREGLAPCYRRDANDEVVCDWGAAGYRLPSEAEWEYACRAGSNEARYGPLEDIAWYRDNADGRAHAVGGKAPNAFGLHDMNGNAWEWCWDIYDAAVYGPYRVFRGGGWSDAPHACRASCRRKSHPSSRIDDLGFRLARSS